MDWDESIPPNRGASGGGASVPGATPGFAGGSVPAAGAAGETSWLGGVEDSTAAGFDSIRQSVPEGLARGSYDVMVGAGKGVYGFGKGMVEGVVDLAKTAGKVVTDPVTRQKTWEGAKSLAGDAYDLQYGTPEQKTAVARKAANYASETAGAIKTEMSSQWAEAVRTGRQAEFVSKMGTRGLLEIASLLVPIGAGAKGASAAGHAASGVSAASKAASAAKAANAAEKAADAGKLAKNGRVLDAVEQSCPRKAASGRAVNEIAVVDNDVRFFKPRGVDPAAVDPKLRANLTNEIRAGGVDAAKSQEYADSMLRTFAEPPTEVPANETLYKIVPRGMPPSQSTPFWMTEVELHKVMANPDRAASLQALPEISPRRAGNSSGWDVYEIKPKEGVSAKVFKGTTANVEEHVQTIVPEKPGSVQRILRSRTISRAGGAEQVAVPNRNLFTEAVPSTKYPGIDF